MVKKILLYFLGGTGIFLWLILIGFFILIILPESSKKSRVVQAELVIRSCQKALTNYFRDNGVYPTTSQGLQSLIYKPVLPPLPKNYPSKGYFRKPVEFLDPWGNPYQYTYQWLNGEHQITIFSLGADGKLGGKEDLNDVVSVCKQRPTEPLKCTFSSSLNQER